MVESESMLTGIYVKLTFAYFRMVETLK